MSETKLSASIRETLSDAGVWSERVQAGIVKVRGGRMHCATAGTPDILIVSPYGWLEVKQPDKDRGPAQVKWHARAAKEGVRVATVSSPGDALKEVLSWK